MKKATGPLGSLIFPTAGEDAEQQELSDRTAGILRQQPLKPNLKLDPQAGILLQDLVRGTNRNACTNPVMKAA